MEKKSIIGFIAITLIVISVIVWKFSIMPKEKPTSLITPKEEEIEEKLKMGFGYSINKYPKAAVREAHGEMITQLEGNEPIFVILTSTVGYNQEQVLAEANRLMPKVKIYGYTSLIGIMSKDDFHIGKGTEEGYVLGLMGFSSNEMVFGVGGCDLDKVTSPQEAGRIAINKAIQNAGKSKEDLPKIVLISTSPFGIGEESVIEGVESVLGEEVPLAGGGVAAGYSDLVSGGETLFANDKTYPKGVVVVPIYTDLRIGHAFLAGFNPTGKKGTVTEFRENGGYHIVEIDNKPAAKIYNNWLNGLFDDYLGTSDMILGEAVSHTLGIKVVETGGFSNWQMIVPFHFNPDDSITVGAPAREGTELHLLESNPELFIQRPALTIRLARSRAAITEEEIAGVVMDQCGGCLLGIPEGIAGWKRMVSQIGPAIGDAPFLGVFNLGPYGCFAGVGNRYGEVTASVIVFSKN